MIYFLMPAYNEETEIESRLRRIADLMTQKGLPFEIWVVNDGSQDRTVPIIQALSKELPVQMINHEVNRGVGVAFSNGLRELAKIAKADDIIITLDADNTHNLKTVEFMIKKIEEGYEVVIGSCFTTGGMMVGVPLRPVSVELCQQPCLSGIIPCQRDTDIYGILPGPQRSRNQACL